MVYLGLVIWDLGSIWEACDFSLCSAAEQVGESESVSCSVMSDSVTTRDCSLPGVSVHGIPQARMLEWAAMPFSREAWNQAYLQGFAESVFDDGRGWGGTVLPHRYHDPLHDTTAYGRMWFLTQVEIHFPKSSENKEVEIPCSFLWSHEQPVTCYHVKRESWARGSSVLPTPTLFDSAACMQRLSQLEVLRLLPVSISVLVFLLEGCCGACLLCSVREDRMEPRVGGSAHHRTLCRVSDGTRCPPVWGNGSYPPSGGLKSVWMSEWKLLAGQVTVLRMGEVKSPFPGAEELLFLETIQNTFSGWLKSSKQCWWQSWTGLAREKEKIN